MNTRTSRRILSLFISLLLFSLTLIPALGSAESLYIIPDSDRRELTEAELWNYRYDTLLYAFNEIYARHGYRFRRNDLLQYFSQFSWYRPTTTDQTIAYNEMSDIERYNIDFIKKHEQ